MYTEIRKLECQGTLANGLVCMNKEEKCMLEQSKNLKESQKLDHGECYILHQIHGHLSF